MAWQWSGMLRSVGSISRRIVRPRVDLPQPDSPTRPSVSPCAIEKLTPSTANTWPVMRWRSPLRIAKCFLRSRTSSTGGPSAPVTRLASAIAIPVKLLRAPARGPMRRVFLLVGRIGFAAALFGKRAARREHATLREVRQGRDHTGDFLQSAGRVILAAHHPKARDRSHQAVRIVVLRA